MVDAVKGLPHDIQALIEIRVWNIKEVQGIRRKQVLKANCIPSIAINNEMVFESIIPPQEDLIEAIFQRAGS